jgi:hypothetical protein
MRHGLRLLPNRCPRLHHPCGMQHPTDRRLRGANPQKALHQVAHPPRPSLGLLRLRCENRFSARLRPAIRLGAHPPHGRFQCRRSAGSIALRPHQRGRVRHPNPGRYLTGWQSLIHNSSRHRHAHIQRPGPSGCAHLCVRSAWTARLCLACHLSAPLLLLRQLDSRTSARGLRHHPIAHQVVRGAEEPQSQCAIGP